MKYRLAIPLLIVIMALGLAWAPAAFAGGIQGQAGSSNTARLALSSSCSMHPDARGDITYNLSGTMLYMVLNGHKLPTDGEYRLYYGTDQYVTARANDDGDLHITAAVNGSGVASSARFELRHIHQHADGASCEQSMGTDCVMLASQPHGYTYQP